MRKGILSLVFVLFVLSLSAQKGSWCGAMSELEKFHKNHPEKAEEFQQDLLNSVKSIKNIRYNKSGNMIIPVVVHVIHFNGAGNISKTQIDDGMRILNEDFNKLNSDTAAVRNVFKPYIADVGIEFKLAKKDPNGLPTEGITRHNSHLTFEPSNRNAPKGIIQWDPFTYMNVWIVNSIVSSGGGSILGFAQFPAPSSGLTSTYGLVVRADEWGSIEAASSTDGRTVTHEIGHCLNLLHTFQSGCGSFCQGSGDFVCDTPPQFDDNNNSCSFSINSCSNDASGGITVNPNPYSSNVNDQLENYMGYGITCLGMFTEGQKTRMLSAINTYQKLDSITSPFNEIQAGVNVGHVAQTPAPIIEVFDQDKFLCAGSSVSFSEDSYGGPLTTYEWTFNGGTPSTSNSATPTVTYNVPGHYDVKLKISNAGGADSVLLSNYVHVSQPTPVYSGFNYNEGFENATSFANDWVILDNYLSPTFSISNFTGYNSSNSLWINNLSSVYETSTDQAVSPGIRMSDVINPSIAMDVAYRRKNTSSNDKINLYASLDCGANWINILSMTPPFFAFDNNTQTSNFIPTQSTQWKTASIPSAFINSSIKNGTNVKFRIEVEYGNGNNIFIDNFRILGQTTSLAEANKQVNDFLMYPNPANDQVRLEFSFDGEHKNVSIYVQNVLGEKVAEIYQGSVQSPRYSFNFNTTDLEAGIYLVTTQIEGVRVTKKLIVR